MSGMYDTKRKILYLLVLLIVPVLFWCIQMVVYHGEKKENLQAVYQLVGEMEEGLSAKEASSNLLKGQMNPEAVKEGLSILMEYGYGRDYETIFDKREAEYAVRMFLFSMLLYLCLIVLFFVLQKRMDEKRQKELAYLQRIFEEFYNGNYEFLADDYGEKKESALVMQMESLGQKLKLNEERLEQEKEETKALVTDLSHQLKTPVASIQMSFQLLEDENLNAEERKEFLVRLGEQIHHLEGLLDALVNISRMESGMIHIQKEETGIFQTVVQAVNEVYVKAENKGIGIEMKDVTKDMEALKLPHDPKWTKEAITNVLDNAVKYSPAGSSIQIKLEKQVHFLRILIKDEGIGVKKEEANRIFQRFYRGKNPVVKQAEGSGVGLYLTRKILEEQGGNITVVFPYRGEQPEGTTFAIMMSLV
ncbi:MAG: sensor histidine kinase [Lachnospiraceae bacterium]